MIIVSLVWLLGASALLWLTWNKVITAFTKMKQAKYWQALLLVFTVCVLLAPCAMKHRKGGWWGGKCHSKHHCAKGECPHSRD